MDNEDIKKEIEFKIPIEELFPKFKEHLEIENNNRILFSGKFGIGKTYFLKEFFRNSQEYEAFHFSPVNYQISSNENIVDFLKYDILIELLKKNPDIFQSNKINGIKDQITLFLSFCKKSISLNKSLRSIVSSGESILELSNNPIFILLSKLGRPMNDLLKFDEMFQRFKKEYKAGEKEVVNNYRKEMSIKNITETDYLSELLKEKIQIQKKDKQSVLILDDLERVDPEHIFRMLNIFSAHFDSQNNELPNKFGFDKIVLVADVQNLKSIFHHKYGENTDFNGYFDKFFSVEIFQFKNEEVIEKTIDEIISHFQIEDKENFGEALSSLGGYLRIFLRDILLKWIKLDGKNKLDLRQLFKGVKYQIPAFKSANYKKNPFVGRDNVCAQLINIGIKSLISISSGIETDFVFVLQEIKNNINKETEIRAYDVFSYCLLKIVSPSEETKGPFQHTWNEYEIDIENQKIQRIIKRLGINKAEVNMPELYLDLLIEYVSKRMYEKEVELF